jgi:hypothetical protein
LAFAAACVTFHNVNILIIVIALATAAYLAFSPRLRKSSDWKAMVTPLASIMGSGFLVSAPLLAGAVGLYAWFSMAGLLLVAYAVGNAIRFNIRYFEPIENKGHGVPQDLALLSRLVLAGAYFISVTYYLQLLAAFVLHLIGVENGVLAHAITTALLLIIGGVGIWRGLAELEGMERYAVSLNLGMIAALLIALMIYNLQLAGSGSWALPDIDSTIDFYDARILLGLLIVVQGFETSRYLGDEHSADQRVRTMRWAQWVASAIYLVFIALATVLFRSDFGTDVTAIMAMTKPVAVVLPVLLAVAAIGSQFSAAVADNAGAGGLLVDLLHHKLRLRLVYLLIMIITIVLTWQTDVNGIIAYASRAFALYYALQCGVALSVTWEKHDLSSRSFHLVWFGLLTLICLAVLILGVPAE